MGARKREEGVRGLKKEEGGWAMADKDKKKLKVILKLPPKSSSSAQPKSSPAAAATALGGGGKAANASAAGGGFTFSGSAIGSSHQFAVGLQDQQKQQHRSRSSGSSRNLQSGHAAGRHGVVTLPGATAAAAAASSGPALFHTAGSFSSVRSSSNSSAGVPLSSAASGAPGGGGSASVLHLLSPPGTSTHSPTPPKKRKFKTVEQAGALGLGAIVVGRSAGSGTAAASDAPGSGRDAGGAAGGTTTAGGGGGGGDPGLGGAGGKRAHGGGKDGGGKGGGAPGGKTGLPPSPSVPFPVKKSHKKQVKPSIQTDGPQSHNPFAGVIMPEKAPSEPLSKTVLEGVLEKLQKKDTYAVFAEPVDATQVPDYYDIIKEPMDFGTMRKKIKKGSYKALEEFEGDIYLICSNAMRYNGPETIYYKQARAIREMARRALEGIRAQLFGEIRKPVSHKKKHSPSTKKSHAKKPTLSKVRLDGIGSDFAYGATLAGDGEHSRGWSNSTVDAGKVKKGLSTEKVVGSAEDSQDAWISQSAAVGNSETREEPSGALLKPMGPKDGRRPLSTEEYHRNTYKQRLLPAHGQGPPLAAVGGESRQLVPVGNQVEHAYAKSLAKFGAGLGPRAWQFIAKRLELLNAPTVQPWTTKDALQPEKLWVPLPSQTGATANSHPPGGKSGVIDGIQASSPIKSGQGGDAVSNRSGEAHSAQGVDFTTSSSGVPDSVTVEDSPPSVPSSLGQVGVSIPTNPSGLSRVADAVVSITSNSVGASNVGDAGGFSQTYTSEVAQGGKALVTASKILPGGMPHIPQSANLTPNKPSASSQAVVSPPNHTYRPPHIGQVLGSIPSSSGLSHAGPTAGSSLNFSGPSYVGQSLGSIFSSSGPLHVQTPTILPAEGVMSTSDRTRFNILQVGSQQGGGISDTQLEKGNCGLDNARSDPCNDAPVHTPGTKQILGLDSDAVSEETKARRQEWIPVTGVLQAVSGLAVGATSKAFSQSWSTMQHGSTSYPYAPLTSSAGREESNAQVQAWAQARVMSLTNPADAKRSLARDAQVLAFLSPNRELTSDFATNLPPILPSNVYADYNSRAPRQITGLSSSSSAPLHPQAEDQRPEAFGNKPAASEQQGASQVLSQGSMRPAPLQQSPLQQRAMPPDLNVALLSPSALQSPPTQQGSTPTSGRHPDLKLQL